MFKSSTFLAVLIAVALGVWLYMGDIVIGGQGQLDTADSADATSEPASSDADEALADDAIAVRVFRSIAQPRQAAIVVRGQTEADDRVHVRAETEGLIAEVAVERGDRVEAGDLLCRIDTAAREATLLQWQAQYEQDEADFAAASELADKGFAAATRVRALRAARDAAKAGVEQARLDLERTEMRAPFAGTVEDLPVRRGARLALGDVCAEIVQIDPMLAVVAVSEQEVGHLVTGMPADVRLVTGEDARGAISFISKAANAATRTFRVEVELANPDQALRSGVTSEVIIPLDPEPAHLLPPSAISLADDGSVGIKLAIDGRAVFTRVQILGDSGDGLWLGGLPETADVIVVGHEYVIDGGRITETRIDGTSS